MHDTSNKYLLQIHPNGLCSKDPINDDLTVKMEILLKNARKGTQYRGFHTCTGCGKMGGSCDLIVGPYITNSLAVHYLRWHRNDVPLSEIEKLRRIGS
jgi:hypothetical protein